MARPISVGLEYFPLDIDIDQDDKIALIEADHGLVGFGIIIKLFMKIYGNGYYYEWGEKEQKLFMRRVNVDINTLSTVVNDAIKWGIFDEDIFSTYEVLTSKGIQTRYLKACERRKEVGIDKKALLLNESECLKYKNLVYVDDNTFSKVVNVDINPYSEEPNAALIPQRKVKESKGKESKGKETIEEEKTENPPVVVADSESKNVFQIYQENFGMLSPIITDELTHWENDLSADLVMEAMKRAALNQKNFSWAVGIMRNWAKKNITTMEQVKAEDVAFSNQQNKKRHYNNGAVNKVEKLPNWATEEQKTNDELLPDDIQEEFAERLRRFREGVME